MPSVLFSSTVLQIGRILLLSLAYFIAGRLALLLAIPPGFASAIFPPLGISLAAVLLWDNSLLLGVLLGSTLLNTSISISSGASFNLATVSVAAEIALGSCLATWAGSSLIRRFIGFPNALTDEWSIFLFFILGGPIASSLSATIGVSTLYGNGVIPISNYVYNWLTWWTGDTIGVLIATPFVFIFYAKPRALWRNRLGGVGIPLLISCLLIVVIFFRSSQSEQQKIQKNFEINAQLIAEKIYGNFDAHIEMLTPLKGLFLTSDAVTQEDFKIFTSTLLASDNSVSALSWDPRISDSERALFEQKKVAEGHRNFFIKERDQDQQFTSARQRNEYVVVSYIEPYAKNSKAHGYDIASEPVRNRALLLANKNGAPVMTAPLAALQSDMKEFGYLIFMPVYKTLDAPETLPQRERLLRGYVAALLKVSAQIESVQHQYSPEKYAITFTDVTDQSSVINLYQDKTADPLPYAKEFLWEEQRYIAGRELLISILPTSKFIEENRQLQSWFVLVGGLLFCSMLGGFLLLVTGRAQYIASLVDQRTLELESILNESVEAIVIVDGNGCVERANPAACHLFLLNEEQIIGINAEKIIPAWSELAKTESISNTEVARSNHIWKAREALGICSDNSYIPIEIGVSRVELPGRYIYTCMIHDIAARKKVDRLKSEFISTVSHELRTPLTSITGVLGLLYGGAIPKIPDKAMELLLIAKNNAERLGRLVNDILDIEKLEFGQLELSATECDVNDLLRQAIVQNTGYAIKYGVNLVFDNSAIADRAVIVSVDPDRFLQVMSNLISNAVKYSNLDGSVIVSVKLDEKILSIYVKDHGSGIPEAFRGRIFQKFAQADSSDTRKRDGTGLGLSITRIIVERMGGEIDYMTEINKGTIFYFSLPVVTKNENSVP